MKKLMDLVFRMSYTLLRGTTDRAVSAIVYDSRRVVPGCVFVALPGTVADGHTFVPEAVTKGAAAVVVEREGVAVPETVTLIQVPDGREALAELSAAWFGHPAEKLLTIGVTGTKGKTTTTHMIRAMLEAAGIPTGLIGTIGVEIGAERFPAVNTTPESWLLQSYFAKMVEEGIRCVVMEVSSQALKLRRVAGFTFDYGIFTNLEPDHIAPGEHDSMADYVACKSRLFRQCRLGIVNADADYLAEVLAGHTCPIETYGIDRPADLRAADIQPVSAPGYQGVRYRLEGAESFPVQVDLPCRFTVYNSLAAIALCRHLGVPREAMQPALDTVQVRGRLEIVPVPGDYTLMIDYAHNAMSLEALLTSLRPTTAGRLICLFGCGGNRAKSRRYEMGAVSGRLADLTIVTSDNPRWEEPLDIIGDILVGVTESGGDYLVVPDRREAIHTAMGLAQPGDLVVLAGKGHEAYQEIQGKHYPMDERRIAAEPQ